MSMGCLLSFLAHKKPEILVQYCVLPRVKHLRPKGKIIVGIDRKYYVPVIDTSFDDYYETSVRLWPRISAHSNYHLLLKAPTVSSSIDTCEEEVTYDTVF